MARHVIAWLIGLSAALAPADQWAQYVADAPKAFVELQPFRSVSQVARRMQDGSAFNIALTNLNPSIGNWYLLDVSQVGEEGTRAEYHLQNVRLKSPLRLVTNDDATVSLIGADGSECRLGLGPDGELARGRQLRIPYASLCGDRMYLRNAVAARGTSLERVTDFLRDHVWGGEQIVSFVKKSVYRDAFLERSEAATDTVPAPPSASTGPAPAAVAQEAAGQAIVPRVGLDIDTSGNGLSPGMWYRLRDVPGVFFSTVAPKHIDAVVLRGRAPSVNALGDIESDALVYLVAFDLDAFDLHFVLGTDHPRVDWSVRPPEASYDPRLPGPDGIATSAPIVRTGMVSPPDVQRTVAAFVGGFKRVHGAFRSGELSLRNHGSHYGFIEEGVIFSKLQPGLATVFVTDDGKVALKTWTQADDAQLSRLRYARQNGVPLIEYDERLGIGVPGALVNQWGPGNWSGSANEDLRTLRAGLCLTERDGRRFLVYGYFSAATPSAMARVFQAYGCRYAMHLDMNALEHTYLALYIRREDVFEVEHLVTGMEEVDRSVGGQLVPRFLGFPDDRDFFYLTRRSPP